jgi:hypothetical protein
MTTRTKELIAVGAITIFSLVFYLGKVSGWKPHQLSVPLSIAAIILIVVSLLWIFIRTIQGHAVGRRIVFLYIGIAVSLPLFMSLTQKIKISPEVMEAYDSLKALPPGSKVLISFDYDPPSAPELQPMAISVLRYCFEHDLKVIIMGLWPQGPQQAQMAVAQAMEDPAIAAKNLKYGVDYVNLGFQTGNEFVIQRMGTDISSMFAKDYLGNSYGDLPLVRNVRNFNNIDFSFNLSAGYPGTVEWVQVAVDRYGLKMAAGNTAVQAPQVYPYLRTGQLKGLLGGMSGAAEFEAAMKQPGKGTKFMLSQSFAHMVVIAFIIIGNVAYFSSGRKKKL